MIYRGIPARFTSIPQAVEIVEAFLATEFEVVDTKIESIKLLIKWFYK
jgi:ribose 5-phosphate isomerase RpiB